MCSSFMMQCTVFVLHVRLQYPTLQVFLLRTFDFTANYHRCWWFLGGGGLSAGYIYWSFWNEALNIFSVFQAILKMWNISLPIFCICIFSILHTEQNNDFYFLVCFCILMVRFSNAKSLFCCKNALFVSFLLKWNVWGC